MAGTPEAGAPATPARRREERALLAASLANGPVELLDFILPLWAGAALGAGPTQVGILVAVELAVSVVVRPLAGVLADARERRSVAAAGALLYALSCAGFAFATGLPVAYAAAVVGGVGGALLWVSVRAVVGERLAEDPAVYPRLTSAEETGAWIAFVGGLTVLSVAGFRAVFLACAAACVLAALALLSAPGRVVPPAAVVPGAIARRLRPMLLAVVVTMAAEAAIALLLLLHLQRHFELEIVEIAYVFLPGAVVMGLLPEYLHRFVVRYGRVRVLAVASVSSAAFAANLAWAPHPAVIAALWVLSGVAWAAVIPIQQSVIAEASGARVGRGMGLYESAVLLGALFGSLSAGVLYDVVPWPVACLAAAAVILSGAALVPWSVRAMRVADVPVASVPAGQVADVPAGPAPSVRVPAPGRAEPPVGAAAGEPVPVSGGSPGEPVPVSGGSPAEPSAVPPARAEPVAPRGRSKLRALGEHAVLFGVAQIVLAALQLSWPVDLVTGAVDLLTGARDRSVTGMADTAYQVGRIWTVVFVIDVVWTLGAEAVRRVGGRR